MKVAHWSLTNGSGMHRVAESLAMHEPGHGVDSVFVDVMRPETYEGVADADVHVCHTHLPDAMQRMATKPYKVVYVAHGTPEHVYAGAVDAGLRDGYGHADGWMLLQHWLQVADARVTFWPRHQAIYQTLVDRGTTVDCVPLGVDTTFWRSGTSRGKFAGAPSVWTGENQHQIKWVLDLLLAWPWVTREVIDAQLHAIYLPKDQHRWLFPLANRNGSAYKAHLSANVYGHEELRNIFQSVDFVIGLVRYGDFNRLCLEANAAGATTISYAGNPYADFWLPEGDQRVLADALIKVLRGETPKREKSPVPDIQETARAMRAIYERVLA